MFIECSGAGEGCDGWNPRLFMIKRGRGLLKDICSYPTAIRVRLRLRLGWGVDGSVPVATPDSVHSTGIELQLSLATTTYPYPS